MSGPSRLCRRSAAAHWRLGAVGGLGPCRANLCSAADWRLAAVGGLPRAWSAGPPAVGDAGRGRDLLGAILPDGPGACPRLGTGMRLGVYIPLDGGFAGAARALGTDGWPLLCLGGAVRSAVPGSLRGLSSGPIAWVRSTGRCLCPACVFRRHGAAPGLLLRPGPGTWLAGGGGTDLPARTGFGPGVPMLMCSTRLRRLARGWTAAGRCACRGASVCPRRRTCARSCGWARARSCRRSCALPCGRVVPSG